MKLTRGATSGSDRAVTRLIGVAVLTLALGIPTFGVLYYRDQHVDAGPTLIERGVVSAEQAVRKTPRDIGLRLQLAGLYQAAKQSDKALEQYDVVLKVDATNRAALLGAGDVLLEKGDLTKSAAAFQKVVKGSKGGEFAQADPQLAKAYLRLGEIATTQGRTKDAVTNLRAALGIDSTDADALFLMAKADLKNNDAESAIKGLNRALEFVPTGWAEPYSTLAQAYTMLGRAPEAEYASAMAQFCQKHPAEAKRRLEALVAGPAKKDAMLGLGLIGEAGSDRAGAIGWYKKVLTTDPKNYNAVTGLNRLEAEGTS